MEELGLRALDRLPRDRALDGIRAFNTMRYVGDHVSGGIQIDYSPEMTSRTSSGLLHRKAEKSRSSMSAGFLKHAQRLRVRVRSNDLDLLSHYIDYRRICIDAGKCYR